MPTPSRTAVESPRPARSDRHTSSPYPGFPNETSRRAKAADHLSGFTRKLVSVASREITDADTARRRKLLVSFALGSNVGIKRIADAIDGHPDDTGVKCANA